MTDRQTDRKTERDRQTERETHRYRDRQTGRHTERDILGFQRVTILGVTSSFSFLISEVKIIIYHF